MRQELFRPTPELPASAMQTHMIAAPMSTHWRRASCEEVGCLDFHNGWMVPLTGMDEGDMWQLEHCGRRYRQADVEGHGPVYVYEAGQPCFRTSEHVIRLDRPELFVVRRGDWRIPFREAARAGQALQFSGPDAWADHLHGHIEKITGR
jgi:hypothetical protein